MTIPLAPGLVFDGRPILSVEQDLADSYRGSDLTVAEHLAELFVPDGDWCHVGPDVHSVTDGGAEVRLRSTAAGWRADSFDSGWGPLAEFGDVPAEHRHAVAVYVDTRERLRACTPTAETLREEGETAPRPSTPWSHVTSGCWMTNCAPSTSSRHHSMGSGARSGRSIC
ncbi:hypothetical protein AB0D10_42845 [Kitasatospora sp. NPDC048545]|uniref:hypothetical protein n=1 Tax=Kitasatospora sp. NPDC048545 TaxID=3157208 RepID=UPI0033F87092